MTDIVNIMLKIVRAQVCGVEYQIDRKFSNEELSALYSVAKVQDFAHLVTSEFRSQNAFADDDTANKLEKYRMVAIYRYENINYELTEICRVFTEAGIAHIPLKGAVMRHFYPEPWMRTSADVDILVKKCDVERAAEVLEKELSYANNGIATHDIQMFSPGGVHVELHFDTVEEKRAVNSNKILSRIWEYAKPSSDSEYTYELDDEMFYFYHVAHMAKHFEYGGCGIRFFLDMWLLRHRKEFDAQKRDALLEAGGIIKFAKYAEALSDVWFSGGDHTEITLAMEEYILNGGVYGSVENTIAVRQIKGGRFSYVLSIIFLPYKSMETIYPSLKKCKLHLPFCHLHRWGRVAFGGRIGKSMDRIKKDAYVAENRTGKVKNMLNTLGLTNASDD